MSIRRSLQALALALAALGASGALRPVVAAELSAAEKAQVVEVSASVLDRYMEKVVLPAFLHLDRARWAATGLPYTDAMADRHRRLVHLVLAHALIEHQAIDKGVEVARRAGATLPPGDPRVDLARRFEAAWATIGGTLAALKARRQIDARHAPLIADLERRYGGHEAFGDAFRSTKLERPGRRCELDTLAFPELTERDFYIADDADYRRYKASHANRDWARRSVRTELIPLITFAPCLARHELLERGDARAALHTIGDAMEVGSLLQLPATMASDDQAGKIWAGIVDPSVAMAIFLGWVAAGMPEPWE